MGIYGLLLTHWFQNGQKRQNHLKIFETRKIFIVLVVKLRQFWSDFGIFGHFWISESRGDRRYPYRPFLVTSNFRPLLLWGQNLGGWSLGRAWPQLAQNLYVTSGWPPTALVSRRKATDYFYKIGPTLVAISNAWFSHEFARFCMIAHDSPQVWTAWTPPQNCTQ